jgi:hypothetical protein
MDNEMTEAFVKTCQLLSERGYKDLSSSEGFIAENIDNDWHISFNPKMESVKLDCGYELPPISVSVDHKGFPAGVFGPFGGAMLSETENDYIEAIDRQLSTKTL